MDQSTLTRQSCPICDSTEFAWGTLSDALYTDNKDSFWVKAITPSSMNARRCRHCGNVQFFTFTDQER